MKKFIVRLVLLTLAFHYVLPMIKGIEVHGTFLNAFGLAFFFSVVAWLVSFAATFLTTLLAVGTLGLALLVLIPLWILGFWMLPAVALKLLAEFSPGYLTIDGWVPAIIGGLCMLFIGVVTDMTVSSHRKEV